MSGNTGGNRHLQSVTRGICGGFSDELVTGPDVPDLLDGMSGLRGPLVAAELIAMFLAWMESRAFSPATIRRRRCSLPDFARFIAPVTLDSVQPDDIEEWLSSKRSARTRHAYRSDLAVFYGWAVRRRLIADNPVAMTDPIRVPKSLPRPIPGGAPSIEHVIATAPGHVRLALMFAVFAGLRRAEITRLTVDDVTLAGVQPMLVVRGGKGGKDRAVPLHPRLRIELSRMRLPSGARYVPVTPGWLGTAVSRHLRACGIDAVLHQGRHSFGTELARVSRDLLLVQQLMGHASPTTTAGYVALNAPGGTEVAGMFAEPPDAA